MLAVAERTRRALSEPERDRVRLHQAPADRLPFADGVVRPRADGVRAAAGAVAPPGAARDPPGAAPGRSRSPSSPGCRAASRSRRIASTTMRWSTRASSRGSRAAATTTSARRRRPSPSSGGRASPTRRRAPRRSSTSSRPSRSSRSSPGSTTRTVRRRSSPRARARSRRTCWRGCGRCRPTGCASWRRSCTRPARRT